MAEIKDSEESSCAFVKVLLQELPEITEENHENSIREFSLHADTDCIAGVLRLNQLIRSFYFLEPNVFPLLLL
jgi:hypothetical protein